MTTGGKRSYAPDPKVKPRGPKREKRTVDRKATTRATLRRRECGICGHPAATGHHVLARGAPYFGDDVPENIVPLCGSGTTGCHGDIEAERVKARRALGRHVVDERPDVVADLTAKLGAVEAAEWLRRRLYAAPR
jgi:hypothetical protein